MLWLSIRNAVENPVARCFYELASRRQTRRQARKGATQGQVSLPCSPGPTNPGTRWNIVKAHSTKGDNHDTFHRYPPSRWPERHKCHLIQEIVPHWAGSKGLCQVYDIASRRTVTEPSLSLRTRSFLTMRKPARHLFGGVSRNCWTAAIGSALIVVARLPTPKSVTTVGSAPIATRTSTTSSANRKIKNNATTAGWTKPFPLRCGRRLLNARGTHTAPSSSGQDAGFSFPKLRFDSAWGYYHWWFLRFVLPCGGCGVDAICCELCLAWSIPWQASFFYSERSASRFRACCEKCIIFKTNL